MTSAVAAGEREDRIRVGVDVVVLSLAPPPAGDLPVLQAYLWRDEGGALRLPGVAVRPAEDPQQAARRVMEAIGIPTPRHLEQLASFGRPDRVPGVRTLSVSYLALLPSPVDAPGDGSHEGAWHAVADVDTATGFTWDHGEILEAGLHRVRSKLGYSTIASGLLPDAFTLSELQEVYEAVLGTTLDKRNFRKRITGLGVLAETGGLRRGAHRPARLYAFRSAELVLFDQVIAST